MKQKERRERVTTPAPQTLGCSNDSAQVAICQARSSTNGSHPFETHSGWNVKIRHYGNGQLFTRILNDTIRDPRLIGLAFKVVCYALSKPIGWQINATDLRKQLRRGKRALRPAMKEIEAIGLARLYRDERARWRWQIRESNTIPWNDDGSVGKIEHYQEGQFHTPILNNTLRDHLLGGTALKIVCDTLSRPATRQLWLWELNERWPLSDYLISRGMRETVKAGYALLILTRDGHRYRIRESPDLQWQKPPPKKCTRRKQHPEKTAPIKNDRIFKNDPSPKVNSALARTTLSPSAFCSEEERRIIERYNQFCDQRNKQLRCRRWLPVTMHTDRLCDAVESWSYDPDQFDELLQRIGSGKVKLRRKCRTLVALLWKGIFVDLATPHVSPKP